MERKFKLPGWAICFLLTLVIFLLQLLPITGMFLMIFGAILWPTILINLGFILMFVDGLRKRPNMGLAIFPVLWFGGYTVAAAISHRQAESFMQATNRFNAGKRIAWDRQRQDLVVLRSDKPGSADNEIQADDFIIKYGLTSIFARPLLDDAMRMTLITTEPCPDDAERRERPRDTSFEDAVDEETLAHGITKFDRAKSLCKVRRPGMPEKASVVVASGPYGRIRGGLVDIDEQTVEIRPVGRSPIAVKFGVAVPLTWFPQPVAGCGLIDAGPSWDCSVGFRRDTAARQTTSPAIELVAVALGLRRTSLRDRFPKAGWE